MWYGYIHIEHRFKAWNIEKTLATASLHATPITNVSFLQAGLGWLTRFKAVYARETSVSNIDKGSIGATSCLEGHKRHNR